MTPHNLIVALDGDDFAENIKRVDMMKPFCRTFKIGHAAYADKHFDALVDYAKRDGHLIFLDLKLWDIPRTILRTINRLRYVDYVTIKWDALDAESLEDIKCFVKPIAVVHLSSNADTEVGNSEWAKFTTARFNGFTDVIISPEFLVNFQSVRNIMSLNKIVPGIRFTNQDENDHAYTMTPKEAFVAGANQIVLGSVLFDSTDPVTQISKILGRA